MRRFGEKLRTLRVYHKVTLAQLSVDLGYHTHSYISEIESGTKIPIVAFVIKVADLFDVTTDELLRDKLEVNIEQSSYNKQT